MKQQKYIKNLFIARFGGCDLNSKKLWNDIDTGFVQSVWQVAVRVLRAQVPQNPPWKVKVYLMTIKRNDLKKLENVWRSMAYLAM